MIKRGDTVMVVKPMPCCGLAERVGKIFTVEHISTDDGYCVKCLSPVKGAQACGNSTNFAHISRLIKIDPPSTGETREAYKNLKVPA